MQRTDTVVRRFAARLHSLREEKQLTQATLASRARLHPHYISALEGAKQIPSLTTLEQLAKGLKVDLAVLVDFPEDHGTTKDRAREELELVNRRLRGCNLDMLRRIRKAVDALVG